jgi:hypothetical protein
MSTNLILPVAVDSVNLLLKLLSKSIIYLRNQVSETYSLQNFQCSQFLIYSSISEIHHNLYPIACVFLCWSVSLLFCLTVALLPISLQKQLLQKMLPVFVFKFNHVCPACSVYFKCSFITLLSRTQGKGRFLFMVTN